jgi:Zn-dependent peptidase ImmA (M78 family)
MAKAPTRKSTDITQPKLRLREELRRKLERAAERLNVSLNAEMVRRLEQSFVRDEQQGALEMQRLWLQGKIEDQQEELEKMRVEMRALVEAIQRLVEQQTLDQLRRGKKD